MLLMPCNQCVASRYPPSNEGIGWVAEETTCTSEGDSLLRQQPIEVVGHQDAEQSPDSILDATIGSCGSRRSVCRSACCACGRWTAVVSSPRRPTTRSTLPHETGMLNRSGCSRSTCLSASLLGDSSASPLRWWPASASRALPAFACTAAGREEALMSVCRPHGTGFTTIRLVIVNPGIIHRKAQSLAP